MRPHFPRSAAFLLPFCVVAASALAQSGTLALSRDDQAFLNYVAEDNQAAIQASMLAEKKADNLAVKAFARLMINDHAAMQSRLASLINRQNIDVPNGIGKEGAQTMARLEPLHGTGFDQHFMQAEIENHRLDVQRFRQALASTQNEGIRQFAAEAVPIFEEHLEMAEAVKQNLPAHQPQVSGGVPSSRAMSKTVP